MEVFTTLKDTPVPTLLVIGGFIFLFLGIATIKKPIVIDVTPSSRKTALALGIILIGAGLYLLSQPTSEPSPAGNEATPTPLIDDHNAGEIFLNEYCQSLGFAEAVLESDNAYGWQCKAIDGTLSSIELVEVCKWQYQDQKPVPRLDDLEDPYSWKCYSQ